MNVIENLWEILKNQARLKIVTASQSEKEELYQLV